jgi:CelD/BcsL family acetyltransferase involved in cellulose biosynthesis
MWKFTAMTSWGDVCNENFWKQWDAWYGQSRSSHVFASVPLGRPWLDTYLPIRDLRPLYIIGECGEGTVFLPLVIWKRSWKHAGQRLLIPVGHSDYDYHDPIAVSGPNPMNWRDYWEQLSQFLGDGRRFGWDVFIVDGLRAPSVEQAGSAFVQEEECPFIPLNQFRSGEDYLATLKKSVRKDFIRRWKRMEERGAVKCSTFGDGRLSEALSALPDLLRHHSQRWPDAYKAPGFHERVVRSAVSAGLAVLQVLSVDDLAIAWQINFTDDDSLRYYIPTYDSQWREYGPGHILRYFGLQLALERGFAQFDFLRGGEQYKVNWAPSTQPLYRLAGASTRLGSTIRSWLADKPQLIASWSRDSQQDVPRANEV